MRRLLRVILALLGLWLSSGWQLALSADYPCLPTEPDSLGPFYEPDAPLRSSVGNGYVLTGKVQSAVDCAPIPRAKIEFWMANPEGQYDDQHRATVIADQTSGYRFESGSPPDDGFRPPHIHLRVTAEGFKPLVTQHYPAEGTSEARFDLVLIPDR